MAKTLLNRRVFLSAVSCAVSAAALSARHKLSEAGADSSDDAVATLLGPHMAPSEPEHIAKLFDSAPTGMLLASYGTFFPKLMSAHDYWMAPGKLENAAEAVQGPKNPHRLAVLPAVAAAHAIPFSGDLQQQELSERIKKALDSPRREEREIILQNLVTASLPSPDVNIRWRVSDDVLNRVVKVIAEARQRPQLIGAASIALTFLLNMRATLRGSGNPADAHTAAKLDVLIDRALSANAAHFVYLREMSKTHLSTFANYMPHVRTSLPSHLTEMILQSRGARRSTPTYNLRLALVHARMTYEVWQTATDQNEFDESVMTKQQAQTALPKLIEFQAASGMDKILPTIGDLTLPASERKFQDFAGGELLHRVSTFRGTEGSRQLQALATHPRAICDCDMQAVADRMGSHGIKPFVDVALELLALLGVHVAVHSLGHSAGEKIDSMQDGVKNAFDLKESPSLNPDAMETVKAEVLKTDSQCGESMDRVNDEIGPSEIRSGPPAGSPPAQE